MTPREEFIWRRYWTQRGGITLIGILFSAQGSDVHLLSPRPAPRQINPVERERLEAADAAKRQTE